MTRRTLCLAAAFLILSASAARAAEGRVPIYQSTDITAPGSYVLTQDVAGSGLRTITISASDVTLDLNGFTISNPGTSWEWSCIFIRAGASRIRIHNGRLVGGGGAVVVEQSATNVDLAVERVDISDAASTAIVVYGARSIEIVSNTIRGGLHGVAVIPAAGTPFTGRISDNVIDVGGNPVTLQWGNQLEVRNNILTARNSNGLAIYYSAGCRIEGNMVRYAGGSALTIGISVNLSGTTGDGNLISGNTVRGFYYGMYVDSRGNRIAGNAVSAGNHGLYVNGSRNMVEDNQLEGSGGCGLYFGGGGSASAYRNNFSRGNAGGSYCGSGGTDAGGNVT